jgi:hypothetical protein
MKKDEKVEKGISIDKRLGILVLESEHQVDPVRLFHERAFGRAAGQTTTA